MIESLTRPDAVSTEQRTVDSTDSARTSEGIRVSPRAEMMAAVSNVDNRLVTPGGSLCKTVFSVLI